MRKISVDITIPFSFPREFEEKFGHFEIRRRHEIFSKVSEFTIDDLMFFSPPSFSDTGVKASVFEKMTLEKGFVPLDVFVPRLSIMTRNFWPTLSPGGLAANISPVTMMLKQSYF